MTMPARSEGRPHKVHVDHGYEYGETYLYCDCTIPEGSLEGENFHGTSAAELTAWLREHDQEEP